MLTQASLLLTEEGEKKFGSGSTWKSKPKSTQYSTDYMDDRPKSLLNKAWSVLFWLVFIGTYLLYLFL